MNFKQPKCVFSIFQLRGGGIEFLKAYTKHDKNGHIM